MAKKITDLLLKLLENLGVIALVIILILLSLPIETAQGLFIAITMSFIAIKVFNINRKYWWLPILISTLIGFKVNSFF